MRLIQYDNSFIIAFLLSVLVVFATILNRSPDITPRANCAEATFENYKVKRYRGIAADRVKFDLHPEAKANIDDIQNAYEMQPEHDGEAQSGEKVPDIEVWDVAFASRYPLAGWVCGPGCMGGAVIDAVSGEVVFYSNHLTLHDFDANEDSDVVISSWDARPDSRLLILNPPCKTNMAAYGNCQSSRAQNNQTYYYLWNNSKFEKVECKRENLRPD